MKARPHLPGLALVLFCLPFGAAPCEWSAGLALLIALVWGKRSHQPLLAPVLAVAIALLIPSLSFGLDGLIAALGKAWPLILLIALPPLLALLDEEAHVNRLIQLGLIAASTAAIWALADSISSGQAPWVEPARGPFSHHLTLGYALVPAAAMALHRRDWIHTGMVSVGILCAGASGPLLALAIVFASLRLRPLHCLVGGIALALVIMGTLAEDPELQTRLVHWTAGAQLTLETGAGSGALEAISDFQLAESRVSSTIEPETHAHDSALQWGILGGLGAWLAWIWLLLRLWQQSGTSGKAAIAALCVGALTQDVFGDLEVLRSLCAWALLSRPYPFEAPVSAAARPGYALGEPIPGTRS